MHREESRAATYQGVENSSSGKRGGTEVSVAASVATPSQPSCVAGVSSFDQGPPTGCEHECRGSVPTEAVIPGREMSLRKKHSLPDRQSGHKDEAGQWKPVIRSRRRHQTGPPLTHRQVTLPAPPQRMVSASPRSEVVEHSMDGTPSLSMTIEKKETLLPGAQLTRLRNKWLRVLRGLFKNLAEQSDKSGRTLDKETFLMYFPLPGILGERLFDFFDVDGSQSIDFDEFLRGLALIYNGTAEERRKFLFDMYDLDGNGRITKEELTSLLSHIPATYKVLHALTDKSFHPEDVEMISDEEEAEFNQRSLQKALRPRSATQRRATRDKRSDGAQQGTIDDRVAFIVDSIFKTAPSANETPKPGEPSGLTYEDFCAASEKYSEIVELHELFFDVGMPDLPVPHDALVRPSATDVLAWEESSRSHSVAAGSQDKPVAWTKSTVSRTANKLVAALRPLRHHRTEPSKPAASFPSSPRRVETPINEEVTASARERRRSVTFQLRESSRVKIQYMPSSGTSAYSDGIIRAPETECALSKTSSGELYDPPSMPCSSEEHEKRSGQPVDAASPSKSGIPVPLVSGWLFKIGRRFHWRLNRFFVLRDRFLYYYRRSEDATPRKVIFLQDARISPVCVTDPKMGHGLSIALPSGRVHRLYCITRLGRDQWVEALSRAARVASFHENYQLHSPRGRGRFAVVYRAVDKSSSESVAVKIIVKENVQREDRQFLRTEVAIMRMIEHPNVVQLLDVYDSADFLYVVMEWVSHGDIRGVIKSLANHESHSCHCECWSHYAGHLNKPDSVSLTSNENITIHAHEASERLALVVARGVLRGLDYLHRRGIIHRDLKPENILEAAPVPVVQYRSPVSSFELKRHSREDTLIAERVGDEGDVHEARYNNATQCPCSACETCSRLRDLKDVKLSDFGLAKILTPTSQAFESLGTLCYAAPEVLLAQPYDCAIDLWSLGVILFEILSGGRALPFGDTDESTVATAVVKGSFSFTPQDLWDDVDPHAKELISELLQPDPSKRPSARKCLDHSWLKERHPILVGPSS